MEFTGYLKQRDTRKVKDALQKIEKMYKVKIGTVTLLKVQHCSGCAYMDNCQEKDCRYW